MEASALKAEWILLSQRGESAHPVSGRASGIVWLKENIKCMAESRWWKDKGKVLPVVI